VARNTEVFVDSLSPKSWFWMVKWRYVVELKCVTWTEPITQKYILLNQLQIKILLIVDNPQPSTKLT